MPAPLSRIGRALLKFFKPIRVAPPHLPGQTPKLGHSSTSSPRSPLAAAEGFRVIKFKQEQPQPGPDKDAGQPSSQAQTETSEAPIYPEKPPAHWLELVVSLLANCRKTADKMKHRAGLSTYQLTLAAKGKAKLKTVGNIIDTEAEDRDTA